MKYIVFSERMPDGIPDIEHTIEIREKRQLMDYKDGVVNATLGKASIEITRLTVKEVTYTNKSVPTVGFMMSDSEARGHDPASPSGPSEF